MKHIVKFKQNILNREKVPLFVQKYALANEVHNLEKFVEHLMQIKQNFNDYPVRLLELYSLIPFPPKSKRCLLEILAISNDGFQLSTTRYHGFKSDDPIVVYVIETTAKDLDVAIGNSVAILDLILTICDNNWEINDLKMTVVNLNATRKGLMEAIEKTGMNKTFICKFIHAIQAYYKKIELPASELPTFKGELILEFSSKKARNHFVKTNALKSIDQSKSFLVVDRSAIKDPINIMKCHENFEIMLEGSEPEWSEVLMPAIEQGDQIAWIGVLDAQIAQFSALKNVIRHTSFVEGKKAKSDYHGEAVASMALAGPSLNNYNDGVGPLSVHLFEVYYDGIRVDELLKNIETAIVNNKHIKVWNLSINLVENAAAEDGVINWFSAALDNLQLQNNVIIVQSAGNNAQNGVEDILAPSDALRSLTVTSAQEDGAPASYSLNGYHKFATRKPDLAIQGGDLGNKLTIMYAGRLAKREGTSFAAPLVARQLAHLHYYEGYTLLEAKALLIHSAFRQTFKKPQLPNDKIGWGVLGKHVDEITLTKDHEIRCLFSGKIADTKMVFNELKIPYENKIEDFSLFATSISSSLLNSQFGAEYVRANVNTFIVPYIGESNKYVSTKSLKPYYANEDDDPRGSEKTLVKDLDKWKTVGCSSRIVINKTKQNFTQWAIRTKIDKRLEVIDKNFKLDYVTVLTMENINHIDRYSEFISQNAIHIEGDLELKPLFLVGDLKISIE